MKRRSFAFLFGLVGCASPRTKHEAMLDEVKRLIRADRKIEPLGKYLPEGLLNGQFTLISGVWVDDRLYYEAIGIGIGKRPKGDDVTDRFPGVPDVVLGTCARCNRSWKWVDGHTTMHSKDTGFAPMCQKCWGDLTPEQRVPFYKIAFDRNVAQGEDHARWPEIERAVLEGK